MGGFKRKKCLRVRAKCAESHHPAHAQSHPGMFYYSIVSNDSVAKSNSPDQTARMRRMIGAFAVRICPKTSFRMARSK